MTTKLAIHHIGGRGGNSEIRRMPRFEGDFVRVLYDADENCIDQIQRNTSQAWLTRFDREEIQNAEYQILPFCIAATTGTAKFHIAYNPNCSSLLPPNPQFDELRRYFPPPKDFDLPFAEVAATVRTADIDTHSLDDLLRRRAETPSPDILSLDVEGGEMEILKGAQEALRNAVCVVSESQFTQLYDGQALFGDLHRFLSERDFFFVKFLNIASYAPFRSPTGLRGDGIAATCDVVYLRDPRKIMAADLPPSEKALSLLKLAFCALMWEQIEVALLAIRAAYELSGTSIPTDRAYLRFLQELKLAADRVPNAFPATYAERYSSEAAHALYEVKSVGAAQRKSLFRRLKNRFRVWRKKKKRALRMWASYQLDFSHSEIETLLREHGFVALSAAIRRNRVLMQMARRADRSPAGI